MKVFSITCQDYYDSCGYFLCPKEYQNLDDFINYINKSNDKFIKIKKLIETNCVSPYFIEEETEDIYINFNLVTRIEIIEATILPKEEYEKRLTECILKHCVDCVNYKEATDGDNLKGHRDKMRLDGVCHYKRIKTDE